MAKLQRISLIVLLAALAAMAVHRLAAPLPDWLVRADGVLILLSTFLVTFSTVRRWKNR